MAARQSIIYNQRWPLDGGESPNAFVPEVTVDFRIFYPPQQRAAARAAFEGAVLEMRYRFEQAASYDNHLEKMIEHLRARRVTQTFVGEEAP